jgi:hypothetical protein
VEFDWKGRRKRSRTADRNRSATAARQNRILPPSVTSLVCALGEEGESISGSKRPERRWIEVKSSR